MAGDGIRSHDLLMYGPELTHLSRLKYDVVIRVLSGQRMKSHTALWHNYNDTRTLLSYQEIFDFNGIQFTPKRNEYDLQRGSRGRAICAVHC